MDFTLANEAMAKCSYEYFVCSESSAQNASLASTIRVWAGLLTQQEMETLLTEIISDLERQTFGR